ncbi:MAG: alpha/beta fold hydrolase [Spirochaetes bacterium]|jgi:predicted alpha/beta-fold hydrolase|nr:alpha/beta fold hydrolase [Spirochaetota bacterium]
MIEGDFRPPWYLRGAFFQSMLNSSGFRNPRFTALAAVEEELIVDAGGGVRLQGFLSRRRDGAPKGLVIILHGWEGSARSAYVLSTGEYLYARGYDVFRLNYRDHGDSHHLNEGLFLGTLIDEVFAAVHHAAGLAARSYLVGFSLGGSFAARIAARCAGEPVAGLRHIVAINPPLDPLASTRAIDRTLFVRAYFLKKWKRSLRKKQELFPERYDFSDMLGMGTCMEMTEELVRRYTDYAGAADYFGRYTLTAGCIDRAAVPLTVLMAADDPVVPAADFHALETNEHSRIIMQRYGGHCGYIDGPRLGSWYQAELVRWFG